VTPAKLGAERRFTRAAGGQLVDQVVAAVRAEPAFRDVDVDELHSLVAATLRALLALEGESDARDGDDDRSRFLRGLLDGTLPAAEVQGRAPAYGLLPGGRYMALRGRPGAHGDVRRLGRAVERSGRTEWGGVLTAAVEGELWGLAPSRPELPEDDGVVGLGTPAELSEAAASFEVAARALETATAFGMDGVVTMDELALLPVVLAEDDLGERLVRRYLEPLRELGEFGETLEHTVDEYLSRGMRIDESAKALIIHPNTLRHRLDRFQQLTGADLRRTEDVVELWWALQRRKVVR
jgi:PucR C-terminal helix-turn-helix domain